MPKYQIYFDTQDGEIHRTVTIDENEVLNDLLGDILAEFEERDGYVLRGWREGLGNPTCRWEGKELDSSMELPEQGVRPNDVIRVSIKRPSLELNRDGELYEITDRTELRTGDEIILGRTMLRFNIKDQQRRIDQSKTFIQRVQQGRSFQQTIWEMALIGALAGVICWFIWSLLQIPLAIDVEYYDMIAFTLLGALIGGLSVGVNDRRLGDAIVPLWIFIGVVGGANNSHSRNERYGMSRAGLLRLDVGGPDHLAPLLGLVGDELAEVGGRADKRCASQVGKLRLHFGIGESSVNLFVELVDHLDRCGLWCADAEPGDRLVARHEFAEGRDVRQRVRARRGGDCERPQPASFDVLD